MIYDAKLVELWSCRWLVAELTADLRSIESEGERRRIEQLISRYQAREQELTD